MIRKINVIGLSVLFAVCLYLADSVIFYSLGKGEYSFLEALITRVPNTLLICRLIMSAGIIIFGILMKGRISEIPFTAKISRSKPISGNDSKKDIDFLSSLSYQIRTPLNAIIGFSELLKKPQLTAESKDIYVNHINSSSKYLLLLINNISEISKIESNQLEINRVECNINRILADLSEEFQLRRKELGKETVNFEIEKSNAPENFLVLTDPERLKNVLSNLLENSFVHTAEGTVKMGFVKKENGFIEFFISDTGRGFSKEKLEIIFNRYLKLTDNENLPFDGSMLRLAISKSLVKLLGGDIWAEPASGEGSKIYFTIPYMEVQTSENEIPSETKKSKVSNDWGNKQILIAEDIESNFIYLREILRHTNVKITWAKNGKEALEAVKSNPDINLVLMDILMPEMDGYEAAREIKKLRFQLPIIAQTAYLIDENTNAEDTKNFDDFLMKPIWAPQLNSMIAKHIL